MVRVHHPVLCLGVTSLLPWQHVTLYTLLSGATSAALSLINVIVLANKGDHYTGAENVSILS